MQLLFILLFISLISAVSPASACGPNSNCNVSDGRYYRIKLPPGYDGNKPVGVLFFAHSLGATAVGTIRNKGLTDTAARLGIALVALKAVREDWNVKNSPANRSDRRSNEFAYFDDVIVDITKRFSIDERRLVFAGASVGGTLTWTVACTGRNRFTAYIPIAGTYWLRPPETCSSPPANIIHIHGSADRTVPLKGRKVGTSRHSDVRDVHKAYAKFGSYKKSGTSSPVDLDCTHSRNPTGKILDFCLHSGGHTFHARHIEAAWKRFREVGIL